MNSKHGKKITLNDFALIVKGGFDEIQHHLERADERLAATPTKDDLTAITTRLDRIENLIIAGHERRFERIEDILRVVVTKLGIKG